MILLCITAPGREYRLTKLTELDSFLAYAEEGRASQVALVVKNLPANAGLIPELGRSPEEAWQPIPVLLPEESNGQRSLVGYSP